MKKLAVFTEGFTEQAFAEKLLLELAGVRNIRIQKEKIRGGGRSGSARTATVLEYSGAKDAHEYYALIKDCGTDNRVTSDVVENYKSLCDQQFDFIIGIRDARGKGVDGNPTRLSDVHKIRNGLKRRIPTVPVNPVMVLAVMETEAWFLAEHTHFSRIDPTLTLDKIIELLNFDPATQNVEEREQPAEDIDSVYRSAGKVYTKEQRCIQRTVDAIDYAILAFQLPNRVADIRPLIDAVENFLA